MAATVVVVVAVVVVVVPAVVVVVVAAVVVVQALRLPDELQQKAAVFLVTVVVTIGRVLVDVSVSEMKRALGSASLFSDSPDSMTSTISFTILLVWASIGSCIETTKPRRQRNSKNPFIVGESRAGWSFSLDRRPTTGR